MSAENVTDGAVEESLQRLETGAATIEDYVVVVERLDACSELEVARHVTNAVDPGCADMERMVELLLATVSNAVEPDPMAVWALGRSSDRRALPVLLDVYRAAIAAGNDDLATRALRSAAGIAPRDMRLVAIDLVDASLPTTRAQVRHVGERFRSAHFFDLYGLAAPELLAIALNASNRAHMAALALARRLQTPESRGEPVEYRPSSHHPVAWSAEDTEAAFLACLDHLATAERPIPGIATALGNYNDRRAAPVLADAVRRAVNMGDDGLAYFGTRALGECAGPEQLEALEYIAAHSTEPVTASLADDIARRFTHRYFAFTREQPAGTSQHDAATALAPELSSYATAISEMLSTAGADDVLVVQPPTAPPGTYRRDDLPEPDRISLGEIRGFVGAWLRGEDACDLRGPGIDIRIWPLYRRVVRVRTDSDSAPYEEIAEQAGMATSELDPSAW